VRFIDVSYASPAENLACDEALLDMCDEGSAGESLRVWESPVHFVVLGFSGETQKEVRIDACAARGIPVLRRVSGGGTVVQGPGVFNYAVVLRPALSHDASSVRGAHAYVLGRIAAGLASLAGEEVTLEGDSDLAIGGRKVSGNAQRRRGRAVLVHGTILLGLDLALLEDVLTLPERRPAYRGRRGHTAFLRNLDLRREDLKRTLREIWHAREPGPAPPGPRLDALIQQRYGRDSWLTRR
jgi:lipoate-protein ligase A